MEAVTSTEKEIKIIFGYMCKGKQDNENLSGEIESFPKIGLQRTNSSFCFLSGAALSANPTLANTNICKGLLGAEILPSWDSPNSFRRIPSSPSLSSKVDMLSSSLQSTLSSLSRSSSNLDELGEDDSYAFNSTPSPRDSFLNAMEVQVAGGAAGEDRVQAVCSEEDGWLFCGIYDGFNGRDAADFLAGTLYDIILMNLNLDLKQDAVRVPNSLASSDGSLQYLLEDGSISRTREYFFMANGKKDEADAIRKHEETSESFRNLVLSSLLRSLSQAEHDFLGMVEQEADDRPDLVSIGSCVLVSLILGEDLYIVSLGDSRAVLATYDCGVGQNLYQETLRAIQLNELHSTDNENERAQLLLEHPDDPNPIVGGKVKGKLKVTRALGVGYLKKKHLNNALMGILRVRNLISPPYVSANPSVNVHRISESDHFMILGSDGLFDFLTNEEAVKLVHSYISSNPCGDPAKFLLEQLVIRAAESAGFTMEELMTIPPPRRRKYHDDVTVIVVMLGANQRTSKASTYLRRRRPSRGPSGAKW